MESCLSFNVWTLGFDKGDLRELPSSFLKRKECKVGENSDLCTRGNGEVRMLLGCSNCLRKSKKRLGGACSLHVQVLVFGAYQHAWFFGFACVGFQLVACE